MSKNLAFLSFDKFDMNVIWNAVSNDTQENVIFDRYVRSVKSLLEHFLDFKVEIAGFKSNRNLSHKEHIAVHTHEYMRFVYCLQCTFGFSIIKSIKYHRCTFINRSEN